MLCLCNDCHWLFLWQESGEDPKGRWTSLTTCTRTCQRWRRLRGYRGSQLTLNHLSTVILSCEELEHVYEENRYKHTMLHFRLPSYFNTMLAAIGAPVITKKTQIKPGIISKRVKQSGCSSVGLKQINSSHWHIQDYLHLTSYTNRSLFLKTGWAAYTVIFRSIFKIHHMLFNTYHPSLLQCVTLWINIWSIPTFSDIENKY